MKLIDLDAKEPYLLDGRYSVDIPDNVSTVRRPQCEDCDALNEYNSLAKSLNTASELLRKKRPQGEWIVVKQDNEGIHEIKCPFCNYSKGSDFSSILIVTFERFPPFCENCGAQMVIKKDSKDG